MEIILTMFFNICALAMGFVVGAGWKEEHGVN